MRGDPMLMERTDQVAVAGDAVVALVGRVQALLRNRLEAQEQRLTAARCGQALEFLVLRGRRSALARPPLAKRCERPEQLFRIARVGADVVVPESDRAGGTPRHLAHDFRDWSVAHGAQAVQERDRAVVAPMWAAAGGDRD